MQWGHLLLKNKGVALVRKGALKAVLLALKAMSTRYLYRGGTVRG